MPIVDINFLLNIVLALIMFGLGLSLKREDFQQLFDQPKSLAIGLFAQMVILPFVAAFIVLQSPLPPEMQVGIMILSLCPGGITSNLVSYFVKGNVALAVSLTVSNALLSLFSIPLVVNLCLRYFMKGAGGEVASLPFWNTLFEIFLVTIIPALLGMSAKRKFGRHAARIGKWVNIVLPLLLFCVFGFKFLAGSQHGGTDMTAADIWLLSPYVISLNIL